MLFRSEGDYTPWVQIGNALEIITQGGPSTTQSIVFEDEAEDPFEDIPGGEGESETSAGESSEGPDE